MGTFRSASNAGNTSTDLTSVNVPVPTGAAAGDIVVIFFAQWNSGGTNPTMTPPSGFSLAHSWVSADGKAHESIWWKRLTGADTGTYAWSWTPSSYTTAQAQCFSGMLAAGSPVGGTDQAAGSYGSIASLSASATAGDVAVWGVYNDVGGSHTPPTGFTETADADCGSMAYEVVSTTGTVTASGASIASTGSAGAGLVVLAGAAGSSINRTPGVASETDVAQPVVRTKQHMLGVSAGTDVARPVVAGRVRALGAPAEAAVARAVTWVKRRALGSPGESDAARIVAAAGGRAPTTGGGGFLSTVAAGRRLIGRTLTDTALPHRRAVASDGGGGQAATYVADATAVRARWSSIVDPSPIEQVEGIFGVPTAQVFFALDSGIGLREGDLLENPADGSMWVVIGRKTPASTFAVVDRVLVREV